MSDTLQSEKIRSDKSKLWGLTIISGFILGSFIYTQFNTLLIIIIVGGIFGYSCIELISNKTEIEINSKGLEVRNSGWYHWDLIESFYIDIEKTEESFDKEYLILRLKDSSTKTILISNLDKTSNEIFSLMQNYKINHSNSNT